MLQVDLEGIEQQVKDRQQMEEEERLRSEAFGEKILVKRHSQM